MCASSTCFLEPSPSDPLERERKAWKCYFIMVFYIVFPNGRLAALLKTKEEKKR